MSDQAIEEGRAALEPIKGNAKTTFDDWLATGAALLVLRAQAMAETKSNPTFGPRYRAAINRLLSSHGLQDIDSHERRLARRRPCAAHPWPQERRAPIPGAHLQDLRSAARRAVSESVTSSRGLIAASRSCT
jgi:hypothetical protein